MILLLLASSLIGAGLLAWYAWTTAEADLTRERIVFGLDAEEAEEEEDLTDPTYGLGPTARFVYRITSFLGTGRGRLMVVVVVGTVAGWISYGQNQSVGGAFTAGAGVGLSAMLLVMWLLFSRVRKRQKQIRNELPYLLEILSALLKGGMVLETALRQLVAEADMRHPLYFEARLLSEAMARGRTRADALRLFARRCNTLEVSDVVSGILQVDGTGGSLSDVMHHHAASIFREVEADMRQQAERLPVKMLFPMLFTIFPAIFVVLLLPNMLRILGMIEAVMGKTQ